MWQVSIAEGNVRDLMVEILDQSNGTALGSLAGALRPYTPAQVPRVCIVVASCIVLVTAERCSHTQP